MRTEEIAEGDRLFTEYVSAQLEPLRRLAFVLCQDAHRADDLVQEAITKLYVNWHNRHKVANLDGYLRTIVVREFLNAKRLGWARRVWLSDRMPDQPSPAGIPVEDRLVLQAAMAQMPPRQRAVVVLRFMCDLPVEAVADILGCSNGTLASAAPQSNEFCPWQRSSAPVEHGFEHHFGICIDRHSSRNKVSGSARSDTHQDMHRQVRQVTRPRTASPNPVCARLERKGLFSIRFATLDTVPLPRGEWAVQNRCLSDLSHLLASTNRTARNPMLT